MFLIDNPSEGGIYGSVKFLHKEPMSFINEGA